MFAKSKCRKVIGCSKYSLDDRDVIGYQKNQFAKYLSYMRLMLHSHNISRIEPHGALSQNNLPEFPAVLASRYKGREIEHSSLQ